MRLLASALFASTVAGCAHVSLSGSDLDRVRRPAFISRIEEGAGPKSTVFRDDGSYAPKLKRLDAREGDRRLSGKLAQGVSRFEVSDSLRGKIFVGLTKEPPWTETIDPAAVASQLEYYLVDEVPANEPDYQLLVELGADAVVELVIEEYGMRSDGGRAGAFIVGRGRMFLLDGGRELWRRSFRADQVDGQSPHLDPFRVAKDPALFRQAMGGLIDGVAAQFAKDLSPSERRPLPPPTPAKSEGEGEEKGKSEQPDEAPTKKFEREKPPEGELPDPDPL